MPLLENFPENFLPVQSNDKKLLNSYTSVQGPFSRHLPKHLIGCKKSKFCELCLVSSIYFWWLRILNFKRLTLCNFVKPNVNKVNECSINQIVLIIITLILIFTNNQSSRLTFSCFQNRQRNDKNNWGIYRNLARKEKFLKYKLCPSYEPKTVLELCCINRKTIYVLLIEI